ncbi:serine/threonine protein kinase [Myriangium duriaei CBS 260.36]|uniref:Serine/threonine protein kinase n=1 Tax=Myriangium duriaei CBS 260.36 TaxID=1168546 RepID=A0A9P4ML63_9PEZI|nr:serine/threonine protein kinase [Myriangium duriaei CBS 260.36]
MRTVSHPSIEAINHPFFNYTSGRWIYNERLRLTERHQTFNVEALMATIAKSVGAHSDDISSLTKIAEGGSFRVFEASFINNDPVIIRIPYPRTLPHGFGVASEVATLEYLRKKGIPVPRVLKWSASHNNPVKAEYMILSKAAGMPLELTWDTMNMGERLKMVQNVVDFERQLFQLELPAYGSIYHKSYLACFPEYTSIAIEGEEDLVIGPSSDLLWWYHGRDQIKADRGPWPDSRAVVTSVGEREMSWLKAFGQPRFPRQPFYRELYDNREVSPLEQIQNLQNYLQVAPLVIPDDTDLRRPTLRHPDLSPNNIFVSSTAEFTCVIDWQHCAVLPLFIQASIPEHFQNFGDEDSENLRPPKPPVIDSESTNSLSPEEHDEIYRKRQLHYFYVGHTSKNNKLHWAALKQNHLVMRNKIYRAAGRPWEGDNTSLKAELIHVSENWPAIASAQAKDMPFPIQFTDEEIRECLDIDRQQVESDAKLQQLRDACPINFQGWVQTELYDEAKAKADYLRGVILEAAAEESEEDRKEMEKLWPFQDHEEID